MTEKKAGGRRSNSGRHPVEDKKLQLALYIRESDINKYSDRITLIRAIFEKMGFSK